MKKIVGLACLAACTTASTSLVDEGVGEQHVREQVYWSDEEFWKTTGLGRYPVHGDVVEIMEDVDMIFDIFESPVLKSLEVNGKFSFQMGQPNIIHSHSIWIRAGEVNVGTEEEPFDHFGYFILHGNEESPIEYDIDPQVAVGSKNMIVTGKLNLFGPQRTRMTRLLISAYPGDDRLWVEPGLDYEAGDRLGLPATNIKVHDSETVEVQSYDIDTGLVILEQPLKGYHFGSEQSNAESYGGVDMRGEVLLLSSNVTITSSDGNNTNLFAAQPSPYGCQVLVTDFQEPVNNESYHVGEINMDNVALWGCSQESTDQPAIKFNNAKKGIKRITNSAISTGLGKGVVINNSKGVEFDGNVIHDFITWGIRADNSQELFINNNVINRIRPENNQALGYMDWDGYNGGLYLSDSTDFFVTNNIAASTWHAGFMLPAYQCGGTQVHSGNVAHSISGYGVIVQKAETTNDCLEFSDFKGYKTRIAVVHMGGGLGAHTNKVHDIVAIDASTGLMAFSSDGGEVEVYDSSFYGEVSPNFDMPIFDDQNQYYYQSSCIPKQGLMIPVFGEHETGVMQAPGQLNKMFAARGYQGGTSYMRNNKFIGYISKTTSCGSAQSAIVTNNMHPDYHSNAYFYETEFENQSQSAMFEFGSPLLYWINPEECGEFACNGLQNVLIAMSNTRYRGTLNPMYMHSDFMVASNNEESVSLQNLDVCKYQSDWNAWQCLSRHLGFLLFESHDDDQMDRSAHPILYRDDQLEFYNRLNAYMDTCLDGTYNCAQREQRFATILETSHQYTIVYNNTSPKKQKIQLDAYSGDTQITLRYPYSDAYYSIYNEAQELVFPNPWDYILRKEAELTSQRGCGENRYVDDENMLQLWMTPQCTLHIIPRDAITLAIRLDVTEEEFNQEEGIGHFKFAQRMAQMLGIQWDGIKLVQVFGEDSVIIEFKILAKDDDEDPMTTLEYLEQEFIETATIWKDYLAPVMKIRTSDGEIISMDGYEDQCLDSIIC